MKTYIILEENDEYGCGGFNDVVAVFDNEDKAKAFVKEHEYKLYESLIIREIPELNTLTPEGEKRVKEIEEYRNNPKPVCQETNALNKMLVAESARMMPYITESNPWGDLIGADK